MRKRSRPYGDGWIYRRGSVWWIGFPGPAGQVRQSVGRGKTEADAEALLKRRLREAANAREGVSKFVGPRGSRITVDELLDRLVADHELRALRSLRTTRQHLKPLRARLGSFRAVAVDDDMVARYVRGRRARGLADATIDRELELLRYAYGLAERGRLVPFKLHVPQLVKPHSNARQGFVEPEPFAVLLAALKDDDTRDFIEWMWWTGMRPGEVAALRWDGFEREPMTLRVRAADAKTGEGRAIPVIDLMRPIVERRLAKRGVPCPLIFHARGKLLTSVKGGFLLRVYRDWRQATAAAGLHGLIPYDLRRTAARNLIAAGVPIKTAMAITGHKTMATFHRYLIVSDRETRAALEAVGRLMGPRLGLAQDTHGGPKK